MHSGDTGPLAVTELTLTAGTAAEPATSGLEAEALDWAGDKRRVSVESATASYLTMYENFNDGWEAKLDGKELRPVRLDGWQQGFAVPAGAPSATATPGPCRNEMR